MNKKVGLTAKGEPFYLHYSKIDSLTQMKNTTLFELGILSGNAAFRVVEKQSGCASHDLGLKQITSTKIDTASLVSTKKEAESSPKAEHIRNYPNTMKNQLKLPLSEIEKKLESPLEDRKIKVFEIKKQSEEEIEAQWDVSHDLSSKELLEIIKQKMITDKSIRKRMFMSEKMKSLEDTRMMLESRLILRIRINNTYVIQAEFNPMEKVTRVHEVILSCVEGINDNDIRLVIPPNKILKSEDTLFDAGIKGRGSMILAGNMKLSLKQWCLDQLEMLPVKSKLQITQDQPPLSSLEPLQDTKEEISKLEHSLVQTHQHEAINSSNVLDKENILKDSLKHSKCKKAVPKWFKAMKK